ncbi:hypothetical protein QLX08_009220 [Tetragonisca angustula]|uniref:Uncharacterized protein n=1 Tax=Tetragonisca angustula TaxID=166442 RepID=A0AAW0ZGS8_9HYME
MSQMENQLQCYLNSRTLTKPTEIKIPKWKLAKVSQKTIRPNPKPLTPMLQNKNSPYPKIKPLFCNLLMVLPLKNTPEQLQT